MNHDAMYKLDTILMKTGDLGFKRRVVTIANWLDIVPGDRILDCGCGEGFYSMVLSELYEECEIIAFDYNAELLIRASQWTNKSTNIKFKNGNIDNGLPFNDGYFDKIVFTEVLEHLNDDCKAISEIYRVLKPGGLVALTVPNRNYPLLWDPLNWVREHLGLGHFNSKNTILGGVWSYDHKRLYTIDQISDLSENSGFSVVDKRSLTHYCMPFNYLILRLGKILTSYFPGSKLNDSTEKFKWDDNKNEKSIVGLLITYIFNLFKIVDRYNDGIEKNMNVSSVSIGLKLKKVIKLD